MTLARIAYEGSGPAVIIGLFPIRPTMSAALALFDLDNTLLAGDSDHAWGEFLIGQGLVDAGAHRSANDAFYQQYLDGELDIHRYVEFTLAPICGLQAEQRQLLHEKFMQDVVSPMMLDKGIALVDSHRQAGDTCVVVTATNAFITAPIAEAFGVSNLLATDLVEAQGMLTGEIAGTPCYREGKVEKLQRWIQQQQSDVSMDNASFYTDSINDLSLLERVSNPVAVDPDPALEKVARERNWKVMSLR